MKPKYWLFLAAGTLTLIFGVNVLIANSRFTFKHPRAPERTFVIGQDNAPHLVLTDEERKDIELVRQDPPQVVVKNAVFDFGDMNRQSVGEHVFEISNDGKSPLTLKKGGSTCKCTAAEVTDQIIPSGQSGTVVVRWSTGSKSDVHYSQFVTIETNDPVRPEVRLGIKGRVADICAVEPSAVAFHSLDPNETGKAGVLLHSRVWESFEVESIQSSLKDISWATRPATAEELAGLNARSGYWMDIQVAANISVGDFHDVLIAKLRANDSEQPAVELQIEVSGSKHGRVTVLGPEIDETGTVHLGSVMQGEQKAAHLLLRFRGEVAEGFQIRGETDCPYLKAVISPRPNARTPGFFDLEILVAQDAPPCSYLYPNPTQLRLISDDPNFPQVNLDVEFAVIRP